MSHRWRPANIAPTLKIIPPRKWRTTNRRAVMLRVLVKTTVNTNTDTFVTIPNFHSFCYT